MITLCTVTTDNNMSCLRHLLTSLANNHKDITQILIADANINGKSKNTTGTIYNIPYKQTVFTPINCMGNEGITEIAYAHPLGLHLCIDQAKTDYVLLVDTDVIFYQNVAHIFRNMYENHNLGIIGIEHTSDIHKQCYGNFPTVITALIHKNKLPPPDFLKGQLKYRGYLYAAEQNNIAYPHGDGKYLLPSPIQEIVHEYPNPNALFDVGCNLWYWFKNSKWLSYNKVQSGPTIYTTNHTNNFNLPPPKQVSNLLFHCGGHNNRLDILTRASNTILI